MHLCGAWMQEFATDFGRGDRPIAIRLERAGSRTTTIELPADRDQTRTVKLAPKKKRTSRGDDETFTNPFAK